MRWLGWSIVGLLSVVFAARWIAPDASMTLIWLNLASGVVYAPALLVGIAAAWARRWVLGAGPAWLWSWPGPA
ncbi:MAG: hypothetical protein GY913_35580 [Proteobacteria bacterium]|nr:hypothetical protein [Pseudomonadota bacterium]MCP4922254.1 hypothetical protein [Pseudomonadota bacterium]